MEISWRNRSKMDLATILIEWMFIEKLYSIFQFYKNFMGNHSEIKEYKNQFQRNIIKFIEHRKQVIRKWSSKIDSSTDKYNIQIWIESIYTELRKNPDSWISQEMIQIMNLIAKEKFYEAYNILRAFQEIESEKQEKCNFETNSLNLYEKYKRKIKEIRQSKNVSVDNNPRISKKINVIDFSEFNFEQSSLQIQLNGNVNRKTIKKIIFLQFNRQRHPFRIIKSQIICKLKTRFQEKIISQQITQQKLKKQIYKGLSASLTILCQFFVKASCLYKQWIMKFGELDQIKYFKYMKNIMIQFIFDEQTHMYQIFYENIKKVNKQYFQKMNLHIYDNVDIKKFGIKDDLQIQGCYANSLQIFSQFDEIRNPKQILYQLENLKKSICNDIDFYHKMFQTGKNQMIDGDNLFGIIAYQICKLKSKFKEIYTQMILINLVYGNRLPIEFGVASYMATVILATIAYIQSEQFLQDMKE